MTNPLSIDKKDIGKFCKKHHISFLALFGSILTKHFKQTSDIDILVKFEKKYIPHLFQFIDMESELSNLLGRKVDLKTPGDLSPYFRDEVLAQAQQLYG